MPERATFRDQAVAMFTEALGTPEVSMVRSGALYRWTLSRGPTAISMFITLDSPEFSDIAHVMISDRQQHQVEPVVSLTMRTPEEVQAVIERIIEQWKGAGARRGS